MHWDGGAGTSHPLPGSVDAVHMVSGSDGCAGGQGMYRYAVPSPRWLVHLPIALPGGP